MENNKGYQEFYIDMVSKSIIKILETSYGKSNFFRYKYDSRNIIFDIRD